MGELSARNFGLVIAYLVPGFITVVAVGGVVPTIQPWLAAPEAQPTVGGFLFVTLASVAAGMLVSSARWMVVDTVHHQTGVKQPRWDFSRLQSNLAAYNLLVEFHYRYYQFNANTFIAVALAYLVRLSGGCRWCGGAGWVDVGFVIVEAVLFATSRDTLRKYYARVSQVLAAGDSSRKEKCHVERRQPSQPDDSGEGPEAQRGQGDASEGGEAGDGPERPDGEG